MAYTIGNHGIAGSTDDKNVSLVVDTTAADILWVKKTWFSLQNEPTFSDDQGNSWNVLTTQVGAITSTRLYWCRPGANVNASHTFTLTQAGGGDEYPSIAAAVGINSASSPFDQESGAAVTTGAVSPTAIDPSEDNCVLIAAFSAFQSNGAAPTIDSGFTRADYLVNNGHYFTCGLAYLIQTTHGSVNPTWTPDPSQTSAAAVMASFKAAAAGGSSIKTIDGLAYASVKTRNGLAIASMKTLNGLA